MSEGQAVLGHEHKGVDRLLQWPIETFPKSNQTFQETKKALSICPAGQGKKPQISNQESSLAAGWIL